MKILSPAKINLRLKVTGRMQNGYHQLSMLNIFCDLCDEIEIATSEIPGIRLHVNPDSLTPDIKKNFVYMAAEKFMSVFEIKEGLNIRLKKNIPAGSGLGGGSSNAAFVLRWLLNRYSAELEQNHSENDIKNYVLRIASEIGSDVAFFLGDGAGLVSGTGNIVEPVKLRFLDDLSFFLVLPEEHVSTEKVYSILREQSDVFAADNVLEKFVATNFQTGKMQYAALLNLIENDLQEIAAGQSALVKQICDRLSDNKKLVCCMSGSGSAFFCLSRSSEQVSDMEYEDLKERLKDLPLQIRKTRFFSLDTNNNS